MPELPEVETVRKGLEKKLKNFIVNEVQILRPSTIGYPKDIDEFIEGVNGSLFDQWQRRGKYLIVNLKKLSSNLKITDKSKFRNNGYLIIHLRMTGYFNWFKRPKTPCNHTRVRFLNERNNELRFVDVRSFGQLWWIKEGLKPEIIIKGLGNLGPEPFSKEFNINYLIEEFSKREKSVKAVLLDQTIIAGIGNIYADESLYEAGISPFRKAKTLKKNELSILRTSIIRILEKSIGSGGTTFSDFRDLEGLNGNYGMLANVYRRSGKECHKCKNLILKKKLGGRSTHWCYKCQK